MKIFAWFFFAVYSFGLILSAIPAMKLGFLAGIVVLIYVVFAQFWVIYCNRATFSGFFKSSAFHFLPLLVISYITGSQLFYFYLSGDQSISMQGLILTFFTLFLPYAILWLQYFLLRKAYKMQGILVIHN